ncbi:Cell division cycle protein 123 [Dissostichus eleginoides]|uniref:Cell division cycle protein 123 n=1 Tax=Dissostichus eleginoides TaxID=100907 RepID=A0AAD9BV19_DISEL|nr:Cell division cycle protein 123 [Dissostichus eleginoides]
MPRGGKKDGKEDQEGGAASSVEPGSTAESKSEGKLEELAGLVTTLVRVQAARDEQAEKASSIQECRWRNMQQQFTEMQQQVSRITQERRQEGDTQDDSQRLMIIVCSAVK